MLPAISAFLSGTVTDTLKGILKPAVLFAAALFVFLNLIFVLVPVSGLDSGLGVAVNALLTLDLVWLAAIFAVVVVTVAYVLGSLNNTILSLMTGEAWGDAWIIGWLAKQWHRLQLRHMNTRIENLTYDDPTRNRLNYEKLTRFPRKESDIAPTALGNVLNANASTLWERYGIDLTTLWPHMRIAIAEKKVLTDQIDQEKVTLDFLLNVSFILGIFVVECVVLNWPLRVTLPLSGGYYLGLLALAYVIYRSGVVKAQSWGHAMLMAFDQEQETLRQHLSLQPFKDRKTAREHWRLLSEYLVYGDRTDRPGAVEQMFDKPEAAPSPPSATATGSPTVSVVFQHETVMLSEPQTEAFTLERGQGVHHYASKIHYMILVSNPVGAQAGLTTWPDANGVFVIVDEQRVSWIDVKPVGTTNWDVEKPVSKQLLWRLKTPLQANESAMLLYSLPMVVWTVKSSHEDLIIDANKSSISAEGSNFRVMVELNNNGQCPIDHGTVEVFDSRITNLDHYDLPPHVKNAEKLSNPVGYRITLSPIPAGKSLSLNLLIKLQEKDDVEPK